jgi:hypothetical protein
MSMKKKVIVIEPKSRVTAEEIDAMLNQLAETITLQSMFSNDWEIHIADAEVSYEKEND